MKGNERITELMHPVERAIDKYPLGKEAKIDIYNRCYEAIAEALILGGRKE